MSNQNILNKAKALSSLINNNSENENSYDFEKMMNIVNSFKLMNQQEEKKIEEPNKLPKISLENPNIKTIKSVLPFVDIEHKKNIGTFIEVMEANHILKEYNVLKNSENIEKIKLKKEAILAIKPHLEDKNKHLLDLIFKFLEINEIANKINSRKEE